MLKTISIRDFILIKELDLDLSEGFVVITGETGAGKSILLDAILFCLGQKITRSPVRPTAEQSSVILEFSAPSYLKDNEDFQGLDIDFSEGIILKATQNIQGRKKFFLNDSLISAKLMSMLFENLVEMYGQHSHTRLLSSSTHMEILDAFALNADLRFAISSKYKEWQRLNAELAQLQADRDKIDQEIDYLEHSCKEISEANIEEGEEERLANQKISLQSAYKFQSALEDALTSMNSLSLGKTILQLQKSVSNYPHPSIEGICTKLDESYSIFEDAKRNIESILDDNSSFDMSLEDIEDRLYQIRSLGRKHQVACDYLPILLGEQQEKLSHLKQQASHEYELEEKISAVQNEYMELAKALSERRSAAVQKLEATVMQELQYLDMKKAVFQIELKPCDISEKGLEQVRFLASTNPGMKIAPIDAIASGGELSRLMLALRVAVLDRNPKQTIICDEIDVGISGSVADSIGSRIKLLSQSLQVLAITHQPQVAGKANEHLFVSKQQKDSETVSSVCVLDKQSRIQELARMISGQDITDAGLKAAEELLG